MFHEFTKGVPRRVFHAKGVPRAVVALVQLFPEWPVRSVSRVNLPQILMVLIFRDLVSVHVTESKVSQYDSSSHEYA